MAERRVLTMLFADLSGYTELTNTHDPEYVEELVQPLLRELAAIAQDHGGQVRPPQGDGFLAVFGVVNAQPDDPRRAVRAAEAMRVRMAVRQGQDPATPGLHVGVASGEVLVRGGVDALTGPAVNLAARLNDQAGRGEVLVDAACVALCAEPSWFDRAHSHVLQGFGAPVLAHRLRPFADATSPPEPAGAVADPEPDALVGRAEELDRLDRCWEEVVSLGASQVVAVTGAVGLGKSALVRTWLSRHRGDLALSAACRDYGHAVPLGALTEAVLSVGGGAADQLAARLAGGRAEGSARRLAALLTAEPGLGPDVEAPHPREDDASLVAALRDLLGDLGRGGPVVLVLEDVHRAGADLVHVLGQLRAAPLAAPLLVLLVGQSAPPADVLVTLAPLTERDIAVLVRRTLEASLDEVTALHRRCGGNPLWLSAILRARPDDTSAVRADAPAGAVPDALRVLVTAQLDPLPELSRAVLRRASVPPDGCPRAWLCREPADQDALEGLLRTGVLHAAGDQVRFAHEVVREVVYASLPRQKRGPLHEGLARDAEDPALRVHHLAQAWRCAVDPVTRSASAAVAVGALVRWAESLQRVHVPSALDALRRYDDLLGAPDLTDPTAVATALSLHAECCLDVERPAEAERLAQRALDLLGPEDPAGHRARLAFAHALFIDGRTAEARSHVDDVLRDPDLPWRWRGRALCMAATTRAYDLQDYASTYEQAYDAFVTAGDDDGAGEAARALVWFHSVSSRSAYGPWLERAERLTRPDHLKGTASVARTRANLAYATHDWPTCRAEAERSLAYARSVGNRDLQVWALVLLTEALLGLGDEPALRRADRELREIAEVGRPRQRLNAQYARARTLVRLGDRSGALAARARAEEVLPLLGPAERSHVALGDGYVALDRGAWQEAVAPFEQTEWEAVQLGWDLSAAEGALGALLARRRLGDADAPSGPAPPRREVRRRARTRGRPSGACCGRTPRRRGFVVARRGGVGGGGRGGA